MFSGGCGWRNCGHVLEDAVVATERSTEVMIKIFAFDHGLMDCLTGLESH